MIISYDRESGVLSVDAEFNKDLNGLLVFSKHLPERTDDLPDDGWEFEQWVRSDRFPGWIGYSIGCARDGVATNLSFAGDISQGGTIYVTNHYTAIVYTSKCGFDVVVKTGHSYERNSVLACLPMYHAASAPSILCGTPCKSFSVVGRMLYMQFESNKLVNYPEFKKAIIRDNRLIGAFGISTGTWNMDIAPTNVEGFRKSLLNRWRGLPSQVSYPPNEGVFISGGRVDAFVRAVQTGLSMNDFEDVASRYIAPASSVIGDKGILYFGVIPEASVLAKHWDTIRDFGVSCNGKIDSFVNEMCSCLSESDLMTAALDADVMLVDSGILRQILDEYELKYDQYKKEQLQLAYNAMVESYSKVNRVINDFRAMTLDVGELAKDSRFDGILLNSLGALRISRASFKSFKDFVDEGSILLAATKGWVDVRAKETDTVIDIEFPLDDKGLAKALRATADQKANDFVSNFEEFETALKNPEVPEIGNCSSFKRNDYFTEHKCHKCRSHEFDTMGFIGNYPPSKDAVLDFITGNGWWLNDDNLLQRGARGDALRRNTRINRVSVRRVGQSYTVDCEVQVYYFGAISRGMDAVCSTSVLCKEIITSLAKSTLMNGKFSSPGKEVTVGVKYIGEADILTNKSAVQDPNNNHVPFTIPLVDCAYPLSCKNRGVIGGRACHVDTRVVSEKYYQGYLQAIKPLIYVVSFPIGADDLFVSMPTKESAPSGSMIADTLTAICDSMRKKVNSRAVKWLIESIRDAGLLSDVKVIGKTESGYVSQETLAHLTDFALGDCADLLSGLESCLSQNMVSDNPDDNDRSVFADYQSERTRINELIASIKRLAKLAEEKAWAYNTGMPVRICTDWNLIGWYLKM